MVNLPISLVVLLVFAAVVLPSHAARETPKSTKFVVHGRVFCDTCRAGFETPASTYLDNVKVRVECRNRKTGSRTCSFDGITDHTGTYNIPVTDEHEHEICESILLSSPDSECATQVPGRERALVFLTHNNGIASDKRFANAMGFQKNTPLPECAQLLQMYQQEDV